MVVLQEIKRFANDVRMLNEQNVSCVFSQDRLSWLVLLVSTLLFFVSGVRSLVSLKSV
jgi:formate hydrogenlyase subunit 3/multisubunit Na+/H+ antiporter MnhD subunit